MTDYDDSLTHNGVDGERLASRLEALSEIGLTEDSGSYRIGFSDEERAAKELVKRWMTEAGLQVREDKAGNVFARMAGKENDLPAVLSGSHVDSVPNGGHFDGPLGVLSALEVVEAWKETGYQSRRPFEVVIFTDEEGSRFNGGLTGSKAMTADLKLEEYAQKKDINGLPFATVLAQYGLSVGAISHAKRDLSEIKAFVEVHIEQGKRLESAQLPVGIVNGIAGPYWMKVTFQGTASHAGNTPMNDRQDALVAASEFITAVRTVPEKISDTAVATVGKLAVFPNGVNVIPGRVELFVDIRDISEEKRDQVVQTIQDEAALAGKKHKVKVHHTCTLNVKPVPIDKSMQERLAESVSRFGVQPLFLPSGAAHDTMILGRHVPAAMLFVQSKDGISHSPDEWSTLNNCVTAVHVLKDFLETLVSE